MFLKSVKIIIILLPIFFGAAYASKATVNIAPSLEFLNHKGHFGYGAYISFTSLKDDLVLRAEKLFGGSNNYGISLGQRFATKKLKLKFITPRMGIKFFKDDEHKPYLTLGVDCNWKYLNIAPLIMFNNDNLKFLLQISI